MIMFRKSLLLFSMISLAVLIAWGIAPNAATPACASTTSAQAGNCALQLTVNQPSLTGTVVSPKKVGVTWQVTNVPPCYKITETKVTFTVTQNNNSTIIKHVTIPGPGNAALADLGLGENLPPPQRPNAIIAEVNVKAEPIDPIKRRTESNTKNL